MSEKSTSSESNSRLTRVGAILLAVVLLSAAWGCGTSSGGQSSSGRRMTPSEVRLQERKDARKADASSPGFFSDVFGWIFGP